MPELDWPKTILIGIIIGAIFSYVFGTIAYIILNTYHNGFYSTFQWMMANYIRFIRAVTSNFQNELLKHDRKITCDPKFFVLYTELENNKTD